MGTAKNGTAPVVIVGGGPVGLSTAMLLARDGHEVVVLEKDEAAPPDKGLDAWSHWERAGVAQFRQGHFMQARFRHVLDAELPAVRDEILANGGARFNMLDALPPTLEDRAPRPGDERYETLVARRPVLESAFARVAERTPGVTIRRGTAVEGPIAGPSRNSVPHIAGVRTTRGEEIRASLVVDAMGRRSRLPEWVAAVGARPIEEEALDAGFIYYTRHFRSRDGSLPELRGPIVAILDSIKVVTQPGDNNAWSFVIAASAGDQPMKALRHNHAWEKVVGAIPHMAHWLDGEPLTDVLAMGGVLDRYRRLVVDGHPVVTGLLPIGDAWACTNPQAGRGMSLGVSQAQVLRDAAREATFDNPVELALVYDRLTEDQLTPWYRQQVEGDRARAVQVQALIEAKPEGQPDEDPRHQMQAAFMAAAGVDPVVARATVEIASCLALPQEIMARPGMVDRVAPFFGTAPRLTPGPTRQQMLAMLN